MVFYFFSPILRIYYIYIHRLLIISRLLNSLLLLKPQFLLLLLDSIYVYSSLSCSALNLSGGSQPLIHTHLFPHNITTIRHYVRHYHFYCHCRYTVYRYKQHTQIHIIILYIPTYDLPICITPLHTLDSTWRVHFILQTFNRYFLYTEIFRFM